MRLTGTSSVDEMIAAFLRAEIDADRWAPGQVLPRLAAHGWPESLVRDPDTTSVAENTMRAALLREYRGWQTETFLFVAFPPDLEWHRTELERAEIGDVLGANFKTWYNLSGSSRRVADSAAVALVGPQPRPPDCADALDVADAAVRAHWIARRYGAGDVLEPPILVAPFSRSPIVAVEGHTRLIGWLIADRPEPFPVIVGLSDRIAEQRFF